MAVRKDKRLIEDYIPIQAISKEASREKSVRKGHISTLHLWWARRPLVACRAAVYGAMTPAGQFMPQNGPEGKRPSLCRANSAKFIERLCKYPGDPRVIKEAEQHILSAHAFRLSEETGKKVTVEDIIEGRAPRPKVLDMFAGGGAIPLEALRLGCDAYALDLNPVAYLVELCTLVYPQKYGKPNKIIKGSGQNGTWAGLSQEVKYWAEWILKEVKKEIGDLYPQIPLNKLERTYKNSELNLIDNDGSLPLNPVAYLWTRTVKCKKPSCGATVPLVKQTWLRRKPKNYAALKYNLDSKGKKVKFQVIEADSIENLGFDPSAFSKGGNATCPFCGTVVDSDYIKKEGCLNRVNLQMMAVVCTHPHLSGKFYISADNLQEFIPQNNLINKRIEELILKSKISKINEPLPKHSEDPNDTRGTLGMGIQPYGIDNFSKLFTPRQMLCLLTFVDILHKTERKIKEIGVDEEHKNAIITTLAAMIDRLASFSSTQCVWLCIEGERTANTFGRQALQMTWDFSEVAPFNEENAGWPMAIDRVIPAVQSAVLDAYAHLERGTAMELPWKSNFFDSIITDPPYYDNVPYSDISDFFYIWLKRSIGHIYPEHFASNLTPKKKEAIADPNRYNGSKDRARQAYEEMMAQSFRESFRTLKSQGQLVVVYAHKTMLGWATLVDALRRAGFTVTEAWPLDTEKPGRLRAQESSALASSIFLVARKRDSQETGSYEEQVRPELESIVKERVESLWEMGISGADLLIACVGAGLRAYTKFAKVEYANGAEVPAEHFLREVESLVLENIIAQLAKITGGGKGRYSLTGIDAATRFYIFWRFTYRNLELDAGEAIIFSYGAHVELDGANGLSAGSRALVEKKKSKYKLRDFTERGEDDKLGIPREDGQSVPLIDTLHRMLWLMDNRPAELPRFLQETKANKEQLRLVAQMLAGTGLKGGEMSNVSPGAELSSLSRLIANWKSIVDEVPLTEGQKQLDFWEKK